MSTCNLSERSLKVLRNYTANWPGTKLGQLGIATLVNEGGTRAPLIWIFNSAHEFPALATELGTDQPLIGLRSLHAVIGLDERSVRDEQALAAYYAAEVAEVLGEQPCFVGGNCQGATIAGELGRELLLAGREVGGFIGMEWAEVPPLPVRSTLLFGASSEAHNPFLKGLDPWPMWQASFPVVQCGFLPGSHGTYFEPHHLPALGSSIRDALTLPPVWRQDGPASEIDGVPEEMASGSSRSVRLVQTDGIEAGDRLLTIWNHHDGSGAGLQHRHVERLRGASRDECRFTLTAPTDRGNWTFQAFLSRAGHGPRAWAVDTRRCWDVAVT